MNKKIFKLNNILSKVLGNDTKRLIFISSFLAHLQHCQVPNKSLILKLNQLLELSNDENALELPMRWNKYIWNNVELDKIFKNKGIDINSYDQIKSLGFYSRKARTISEEIINAAPSYLWYSSKSRMRADLVKVFQNLGSLTQMSHT